MAVTVITQASFYYLAQAIEPEFESIAQSFLDFLAVQGQVVLFDLDDSLMEDF